MSTLLEVRDLRVSFPEGGGRLCPVDRVSFDLAVGETLALVGESGCGKSLTALALLRLLPRGGRIEAGSAVRLGEVDLLALDERRLQTVRGRRIGMVFQDPMTSLNPLFTVGSQIAEALRAHRTIDRREARDRAIALLDEVGIADATARYEQYPHELSGGMRQRVMIAIALSCDPEILIADEPTTALDVTVQAQILEILDRLQQSHGMAILLITHDLGIVAGRADRVAVMYAGRLAETAPTDALFGAPAHPYTRALLASVPRLEGPRRPLQPIAGSVPTPAAWPTGCRFHPRCPVAFDRCPLESPPLVSAGAAHRAACFLVEGG